jgi:stage II sporulation protein D
VDHLLIGGKKFSGLELRRIFGLRSTVFTITADSTGVTFQTTGYGHRVGLSQHGADALADQGYDYEQILAHYYRGTTLEPYVPH